MANVLGELFSDIADAIRGKTGDSATMKPAEFPAKIAAIETGGGSGGGTLPAGVYWEQAPVSHTTAKGATTYFKHNGVLYAFTCDTNGSGNVYLKKWNGTGWETAIAAGQISYVNAFLPTDYVSIVEVNGQLHLIGGDSKYHYIFGDGATFDKKANLPKGAYTGGTAIAYNGEIYALRNDGVMYKWDEATDTWSSFCPGFDTSEEMPFVHDGCIHSVNRKGVVSRVSNGVKETVMALSVDYNYGSFHYLNGQLYWARGGTGYFPQPLRKYDLSTGAATELGYLPVQGIYYRMFAMDGKVHISGGTNSYGALLIMHEV